MIDRTPLFAFLTVAAVVSLAAAADLPAELPAPDGRAPDATKPVKVYLLAGQSNMVGMGEIGGAKCRYSGLYLTADPAARKGPLSLYPVGNYKIASLDLRVSAEDNAERGAVAALYAGAYDPATDYDNATPTKTVAVALGVTEGTLPTLPGPHTVVVRGFLQVPETGVYTVGAGFRDSSYNVTQLDGKEVYRSSPGKRPVKQQVSLEAGKWYPLRILYFKGGSCAFWLSQEDLSGKGDLETVTKREKKFPYLLDAQGKWAVRNDVYYYDARISFKGSPLSPTSNNGKTIGPELSFGHVMGTYHDQQVLLIKTAMGNRALGWDFRPPSSGHTQKESADKWEGLEYRLMIEGVHKVLDDLEHVLPGYKGQGYELAGFVWWQGHKDSGLEGLADEYEQNLVNLIKDVRAEFHAPKLPVVIVTVGFGGHAMGESFQKIWEAQMAVGDPKRHPELAGTVATVDIRDFWREVDQSPADQGYHYNRNAETYLLVGESAGRAMVKLLGGTAAPMAPAKQPVQVPQTADAPTAEEEAASRVALAPIILEGLVPAYEASNRAALLSEAKGERPKRESQFLLGALDKLTELYRAAGVHDYDWHVFGPDLREVEWEYFSFDPPETLPKEKGPRYRKVTYPKGMEHWFAPDFDAAAAGWKKGRPPFGQLDGKLAPLRDSCTLPFCGCSQPPKTLWEKEVLLARTTFDAPPLQAGHRYRLVVGGSAHVNSGEGYALYVNGKLVAESRVGVAVRQGAQPRGGHIYADTRDLFSGGKTTLAVTSFLRYNHPRSGLIPPRGHLSVWLEEMKVPPLAEEN